VVKKLIAHSRGIDQDSRRVILEAARDLRETNREEVWEEFELRFRHVHEDFYQKIHERCPSLTGNERRLAAFLRLNLSTKEIATLTGQSIRALEVARTRLRKKLNLTNSETGLVEYLASL
jgi:DNA-binding CsgD family transcriptional regulator